MARAFPESNRPDYITSQDFYKFTPADQFMSLPGEIARTEFRLVATHDGYEYTVLERELGAHRDPERKMLVTVREVLPASPKISSSVAALHPPVPASSLPIPHWLPAEALPAMVSFPYLHVSAIGIASLENRQHPMPLSCPGSAQEMEISSQSGLSTRALYPTPCSCAHAYASSTES